MRSEFVVSLTVGPILCASLAATYVEFKVRRKSGRSALEWVLRATFQYALPALALCAFLAYVFSTFVIIPFFPGSASLCGLHNPDCLARVDPALNFSASVAALVAAELLSLCYMCFVVWRRTSPRHVIIHR